MIITVVTRWVQKNVLLAGMFAILVTPSMSYAEQFVLFDVTFTFTKEDADNSKPSKSHYYVREKMLNPDRPKDWTDPVDYRNGTIHIRTEVIEKPEGGEPTTWSICYIPNKGQKNGYGCTGTVVYREKGVYDQDVSMKSFWQNDSIVWSEGIKQMDLVIKDNSGGSGHAHKRADWEKFFPTKMRITVVQVSAGSKYDASLVPNLPTKKGDDGKKPKDGGSCDCCSAVVDSSTDADDKRDTSKEGSDDAVQQVGIEEVTRLIGELDAKQYSVREAATEKLMKAGKVAIASLTKAAVSGDSFEAAMRAITILKKHLQDGDEPTQAATRAIGRGPQTM